MFSAGERIAITVTVLLVAIPALLGPGGPFRSTGPRLDAAGVVILLGAFALLALRHRAPLIVASGNVGLLVMWYAAGYINALIHVPYIIAFFSIGGRTSRRAQVLVVGIAAVALVACVVGVEGEPLSTAASAIAWTMTAVLVGELAANRRELVAALHQRAVKAEADRDAEAERRVATAKLEIAHDLHDVLAHTVSVIAIQANVGQEALDRGDHAAADALNHIQVAGRQAMAEVRAIVGVLRDPQRPSATAPSPRLEQLPELFESARRSGLAVETSLTLPPGGFSDVIELTAFRVVQEGLTNVLRHSPACRARVGVFVEHDRLVVDIVDSGPRVSTASGSGGFGLIGMRERVDAVGGRLVTGPTPGGWRVRAELPTGSASP